MTNKYAGERLLKVDRHDDETLNTLLQVFQRAANAIEQAINVCQTTIVQDAWVRGQNLTVHACIYGLKDGVLKDLGMSISSLEEMNSNYLNALALEGIGVKDFTRLPRIVH